VQIVVERGDAGRYPGASRHHGRRTRPRRRRCGRCLCLS
jgi:hypothetical protein